MSFVSRMVNGESALTPVGKTALVMSTAILIIGLPTIAQAYTGHPTQVEQQVTISFVHALLIGLGYYLSQSPWFFGLGFFTLNRPLLAGFCVGLILGDPGQGALIGAAINLVYLGFISAGGSIPGDPGLAGWVGTTIALAGGLNYGAALAIAVPIGLLGTLIWNARMTVDAAFIHMADRSAKKADIGGVVRANILYPQLFLFAITAVPVTIAVYLGTDFIVMILGTFPIWILSGLAIAGGVLPAIGIAMNMRFIFRGTAIPYFFLGYLAMVILGDAMSIMLLAVIGAALAVLHVTLLGDRGTPKENDEKPEPTKSSSLAERRRAGAQAAAKAQEEESQR
ncbi:PTS mannose/fructose/sorbose/N-acetylgalactosamine transporter subunit IIC [Humidisolicoccus flavus]|uniref:PTS mannose/fructose/sorbose/N-acetylgalactosamine transporter subunit IIC n=1 Tax=Humidisolicoccus flavus TaxID=3111414 RepID=UPI00324EAEEA